MAAYLICYVARKPSQQSDAARADIARRVSERWRATLPLDATWIIHAEQTSDEIRDELVPYLACGDALIVVGAGSDAAWAGFQLTESDWLVEHI
jgi:hypothetical protein